MPFFKNLHTTLLPYIMHLPKILQYLLRWHLWVSAAAVCATAQTYLVLQQSIPSNALLLLALVGTATFSTYRLAYRLSWIITQTTITAKNIWRSLGIEIWAAWVICGYCFLQLNKPTQYTIALSGIVAIIYSLPFLRWQGRWLRLRDVSYLKIILIVFIWTSVTVVLPYLNSPQIMVSKGQLILLFIERLLFYLAITLPFDVRDYTADTQHGLSTLVTYLGKNNTLKLSFGTLISSALVAIYHYFYLYPQYQLGASILLIYPFIGYLLAQNLSTKPYWFYSLFLDGCMIAQFLVVFTMQFN